MLHEFFRLSSEGIWCFQVDPPVSTALTEEEQVARFFEGAYLIECSDIMAQMYGFDRGEELHGMRLGQFMSREDPQNIEYLRAFIASDYHLRDAESVEFDRHGSPKWFLNNLTGVIEEGHLVRAWGMQRDVTEAKLAEEARRASEKLFRSLVELVPQMLWIMRATGVIEYWSTHGLAYFGKGTKELSVWNWAGIIHADDIDQVREQWFRCQEVGERFEVVSRLRRHDGEYRWHIALANCERDAKGNVTRWYGTCADIHEQWLAQAALSQARDAAEAANRAKDQFLAVLSHELRTPLNPVLIAASELARDPSLPERVREDARTIRQNVELEARIIDDLLDLTRITHGKLRLRVEHLDLVAAMRDVLKICGADAEAKHLQVAVEIDVRRSLVLGDGARIRQVLWNLLNNAIKFTDRGGSIVVRLLGRELSGKPAIAVEIQDTGVGISPESLDRIFHAFEQDTAHGRVFGGLGLGLAISQHIAEAHDGRLEAASAGRDQGSVFTFTLPLAEPSKEHAKPVARGNGSLAPKRSLRVLLVEDHEDTRRLLMRLLVKQGHHVEAAGTVAEAVAVAEKETFELLISDIGLPDGTGHDVARHIMAIRPIPAIALTGYGMDEDLRRATEAGFAVHLTKPVDFSLLLKTMAQVMAESGE